jgi:hypothetical protein
MERIRTIVNKQVNGQYPPWQLAEDLRLLFSFKMHPSDSIHAHAAKWKELLKNVTSRWGDFGPTKLEAGQSLDEERDKLHACLLLANLDRGRYGHVIQELNNDYLIAQKGYPPSIDGMITYLDGRMDRNKNKQRQVTSSNVDNEHEGTGATSFHQTDSTSNTHKDDDITEAQFHQYLNSIGVSYHDFSLGVGDSESESEVGWPAETIKKHNKKNKHKKT